MHISDERGKFLAAGISPYSDTRRWVVRSGSQMLLQFIPQALDGVELQTRCWRSHFGNVLKELFTYFMPRNYFIDLSCLYFTLYRTEAPFLVFVIAGGGGTPLKMVFQALSCALRVPLVVVFKGQSTGHAMRISQQSVDICKYNTPSTKRTDTYPVQTSERITKVF